MPSSLRRQHWTVFLAVIVMGCSIPVVSAVPPTVYYSDAPLQFEPNFGQFSLPGAYVARGRGLLVYVDSVSATVLTSDNKRKPVRLTLLRADANARATALDRVPGTVSYFLGKDPTAWRTRIPAFAKLRYEQVYPGIDVVYYGHGQHVEYDFVVQPGSKPAQIKLAVSGAAFRVDNRGDLVLALASGELRWSKPVLYQKTAAGRKTISGGYVLRPDGSISFNVGSYDQQLPLYIDPEVTYATYLGGTYVDEIWSTTADTDGNAYVTGRSESPDFPFSSPVANFNGKHAFVVKYAPNGQRIYSVYMGGTDGDDGAFGIAVDSSGSPYVVGTTTATNFPTTANAFARSCTLSPSQTCSAAFMAKLQPDGSGLLYSTYISGGFNTEWSTAAFDEGYAIAVDGSGIAYAGGATQSAHFPTTDGTFQRSFGGARDGWLMKIDTTKSGSASLLWSTYLGGADLDTVYSVAVDALGNVYAGGETYGSFPVKNALVANAQGLRDGFVAKVVPSGSDVVYATYLGGSDTDVVMGVAADANGYAYVTGQTKSPDFPQHNAAQPIIGGGAEWGRTTGDAYVTKITPTGDAFVYSTFLGGQSFDWGQAIAADSGGNAYVTGMTDSAEFPIVSGAPETWHGGNDHAFYTQLNAEGGLSASTFVGTYSQGNAIAVDPQGGVIVAGITTGSDFPTKNPSQPMSGGSIDGFVAKIASTQIGNADLALAATTTADFANSQVTYDITVTNNGPYSASGVVVRDALPEGATFYSASAPLECFGTAPVCKLGVLAAGAQAKASFTAFLTTGTNLVNTASVAAYDFDANLANNEQISTASYASVDLRASMNASANPAWVGEDLTLTVSLSNLGPDAAPETVLTHIPPPNVTVISVPQNCTGTSPITCQLGTVAKDASSTLDFIERPTSTADLTETFNVRASAIDTNLGNNTAWMHIPVWTSTTADLRLEMNASPAPVPIGSKLSVAMNITNLGSTAATQVHLVAPDPAAVAYDSVTSGAWTCTHIRGQLDCTLASLAGGAASSVTVVYVVQGSSFVSGSGQVSAAETDPAPADNMATFYINVADFDITPENASSTVRAGQSATYTINIDPKPAGIAFNSAISFSCSGQPSLASCIFSPASVTPGAGRATTRLTISTTAPSTAELRPLHRFWQGVSALALFLPLLGIMTRSKRRSHWPLLVFMGLLLIGMIACGSGGGSNVRPGTPTGSYQVTVMASVGGTSHNTTLTLNVQ